MNKNRITTAETLLVETIGTDEVLRVLCVAAKKPIDWISRSQKSNPPAISATSRESTDTR